MITAVAYSRLSADEKHTGSISFAVQADHIKALAESIGATVVESVQDNAISGAVPFKKRPGGRRVQALVANGTVNAILALRQERLFRDTQEALNYIDLWKQNKVSVYFAEDGGVPLDTTSPSGMLVFTVKAAASSFERQQIALRIRENKAARRKQGKSYSPPRYGYDQVGGYEVENPVEQAVIARIVELRRDGLSLRAICRALDAAGHRPKRATAGSRWSAQAVCDILDRVIPSPPSEPPNGRSS
jgi:DNA invertase Pin-like site-specific DNA recombinase